MRDCARSAAGAFLAVLMCWAWVDSAQAQGAPKPDSAAAMLAPQDWSGPLGIEAKKPVFAGACKVCPWGQLAIVVRQAMLRYGYDVHICWTCAAATGPRSMGDKSTLQQQFAANSGIDPEANLDDPNAFGRLIDTTPPTVPDISATNENNLMDAWNGVGPYAEDKKKRQNYRVVASILSPQYLVIAVNRKSGITDLSQVKSRRNVWVVASQADAVLAQYGITQEGLEANGGGFISGNASREMKAAATLWIGGAALANTYEQRMWYEISQMNDLLFLQMDEALIEKLAATGYYERTTMPFGYMRGMERPVATVKRVGGHLIYVRDEAPDDFAYTLAKALDENRALLREQVSPWYYDSDTVAKSRLPLHPGAIAYYREQGYLK